MKQANSHQRTRHAHLTESAEDYVEAIADVLESQDVCRVVDLARIFCVSHVTVNRKLQRLQRDGLIQTAPYMPVTLTETGAQLAKTAKQRHQVVYQFLIDLGVSAQAAEIDAEGIEHHVSPETLKLMKAFSAEKKAGSAE